MHLIMSVCNIYILSASVTLCCWCVILYSYRYSTAITKSIPAVYQITCEVKGNIYHVSIDISMTESRIIF